MKSEEPYERPTRPLENYFTCWDLITPDGVTTTVYTERLILKGQILRIGTQQYVVHYVGLHPGKPANVVVLRQRLRDHVRSLYLRWRM